jgi:hypothetical protein
MKRLIVGVAVLGAAAVLGGCPIYPSNTDYRVCSGPTCYDCPSTGYDPTACVPWQCSADTDCGQGYACSQTGTCYVPNSYDGGGPLVCQTPADCTSGLTCGADGTCHTGDCVSVGCVSGYVCKLANGSASCVLSSPPPPNDSGTDSGQNMDAGGGDASDGAPQVVACVFDTDCSANSFCVDGTCTIRANLCADGTQCRVSGYACVEGRCTAHCDQNNPCATGYACNYNLNVCNINPLVQGCSQQADCQGGTVCVESRCVAPAVDTDAGFSCPAGQVVVQGLQQSLQGCLVDEAAVFACTNDGVEGSAANSCANGNLCLHHSCYTDCGGNANTCMGTAAMCKAVTIPQGTFSVCGTATNLGSACNPQTGLACNAQTCVDGYCK